MESAITHEDNVITAYRCHPFAVLRGGTIHSVLAELLGTSCVARRRIALILQPSRQGDRYRKGKGWFHAHVHKVLLRW